MTISRLDQIFYHPATQAALTVVIVLGLMALVVLLLGKVDGRRRRVAQGLVGLLVLAALASMLIEELLPMVGRAPPRRVAEAALGMAGFLAATAVLIAGAGRMIAATFRTMARAASRGPRPRVPLRGWLAVWAPGLRLMGAAAVLFVLAAALYHEDRFPLGALLP